MRDIHCPKDIGLENTFSGEDCEKEQYYNNCYHCWSTALAKRRRSHWMKTPRAVMGEGYMWYCNKCEYEVYQDSSRPYPREKYCPNCGCRMVEQKESEVAESNNIYCTECPYFNTVINDGEQWFGARCDKDGHSTIPSMYAIKSLHNDCPLVTVVDPPESEVR